MEDSSHSSAGGGAVTHLADFISGAARDKCLGIMSHSKRRRRQVIQLSNREARPLSGTEWLSASGFRHRDHVRTNILHVTRVVDPSLM